MPDRLGSDLRAEAVYKPPAVGNAETISAMLAPRVKHMVAPKIQHHTT